ncbi:MAG: hypothetical protein FD175_2450 [Beijerinckiaceae bacterium]|nr:MAG: hypothetical protein FD175_2450 [Beijerinckiaceae bacterium]
MTTTPNLTLPYLAAGQAQKHVTLNESLRMLDALVQLSAVSRAISTPPASPAEGHRYIIAAGASGVWSGHVGKVAAFQDGGWMIYAPKEGWLVYVQDEDKLYAFDGAAWLVAGGASQSQPLFGVNATADTTNRLSVSSPATLFNHEGAGHQLKLNKAAAAQTASILFQTGFSGRAEIGTAGDDLFRLKTSADGATWRNVLTVDQTNGNTGVGISTISMSTRFNVESPDGGTARFVNAGGGGAGGGAGLLTYTWVTPVAAGDRFGQILFGSLCDGTMPGGVNAAGFSAHADGAWTVGSSHPSMIRFDTTPSGGAGRAERLRITSSGKVGIGTTTPSATLHVNGELRIGSFTVAGLPSASTLGAGAVVFVSNESGGAVLAFSDGTNWRRVTDRAIVT